MGCPQEAVSEICFPSDALTAFSLISGPILSKIPSEFPRKAVHYFSGHCKEPPACFLFLAYPILMKLLKKNLNKENPHT